MINVYVEQDIELQFSGKGSVAGVMLSPSLGPMGIAVGVAIDQGIAKDLRARLKERNIELRTIIDSAFSQSHSALTPEFFPLSEHQKRRVPYLVIRQYGFKAIPEGERVRPILEGGIVCGGEPTGLASYSSVEVEAEPAPELSDLRASGEAISISLTAHLARLINASCLMSQSFNSAR